MTVMRFTWIVAVVTMLAPVVVSLASENKPAPATANVPTPTELTAMAEACGLQKTYGLGVVAMPAAPSARSVAHVTLDASELTTSPEVVFAAAPVITCPEIRAIVASDVRSEAFAIMAWGDLSYVVKVGSTVRAPFGDVTLQRLRSRSITLAASDVTLQCNLLVR